MYYSSPQIDPVRNAVSSSEQTSLHCSSVPTQRARCSDKHAEGACVCVYVCISTHTLHTHIDTLTARSRRRGVGAKCPALLLSLWSVDVLSSYKNCCTNVDCPRHLSPSLSLCLPSVSFFLSCSPCSFRSVSPFHTASSYICSFQSCKWLQLLSPLSTLQLSLRWLSPSVPSCPLSLPRMPFFHHSCSSLSTPWSRPIHKLWSAVKKKCTFIVCEKELKKKKERWGKRWKGTFGATIVSRDNGAS